MIQRNGAVIGYSILVVLIVAAFVQTGNVSNRVEDEAIARSNATCESLNELRVQILFALNALPPRPAVPGEIEDPATAEYLAQIKRDTDAFRESFSVFESIECPPPPTPRRWSP